MGTDQTFPDERSASEVETKPRWIARRWVILAQVAFAALLFMAITQLSQVIVTRGLALLGMRTDVATIIAVEACGKKIPTAPASVIRADHEPMRVEICSKATTDRSGTKVTAAVPSGQSVTLLVNGNRAETRQSAAARITFENVKLHPGDNTLAVAVGERAISELQFEPVTQSYSRTQFGLLRNLPVGSPITVSVRQGRGTGRIVGGMADPNGAFLLVSGEPDTSLQMAGIGDYVWIGPSGFAVVRVDTLPKDVAPLTVEQFRRSAKVSRLSSGELLLSAEACLPKDSALARWAGDGTLSANDLFTRLTGLRFDTVPKRPPARTARLTISDAPSCRTVRSLSAIPVSAVSRWRGGLLSTPFDTLQFQGFDDRLQFSQAPSSTAAPDVVTFNGRWLGDDDDTLRVDTDYALFTAEVNARPEPAAHTRPIVSRLAAAWARAEGSLPPWLRALLSGIAAVAPILVLLFAIRRAAAAEPVVVTAKTDVTAGLSVLLLLALGAAAQPLLFQLFFRMSDLLELWDILAETRGDNRWFYPDPYGPVALAIAMMLIPFLRALRTREGEHQSALVAFLCCITSFVAVFALFAAALVQRLPWQGGREVWAIRLLDSYGITVEPAWTLPVAAGALALALATAWIPLFWAFRAMAPRRGYLGASILAGAAAILLPLFGYAVEAGRLLLLPEGGRSAGQPSLLALLGSSVLPFTLFIVLLLAFRAVVTAAVPDARTKQATKLLRPRNLVLVAIVLVLPRLGLGQVAIAPSDMGIIDILSIFQSFGLVAAVLLAVILLKAYSPLAPPGDTVRKPLLPFAFRPDELDIITALFVGYLAMWTSGILATAVAVAVGWPLFKRLIIEPDLALPDSLATPELAKALVEHRRNLALFEARSKELEARYSKVESDFATLTTERKAIETERSTLDTSLGMSPSEAKRRLLEFGPGSSPFANGIRGAVAGLAFAVVLQLATSIYGADASGPMTSWADLARKALADPVYSIAPVGSQRVEGAFSDLPRVATPDLLLFIGALINACFPWVLLGFIFGFAFHRVRGDDGVIKGLVFATAIAIAYGFSQLFVPGAQGIQVGRVIPVFLFLLLLGIAVFDATSLARQKLSPTQLGDVYGFRTSLGYASLIGGVAAFEPILKLIGGLFAKA